MIGWDKDLASFIPGPQILVQSRAPQCTLKLTESSPALGYYLGLWKMWGFTSGLSKCVLCPPPEKRNYMLEVNFKVILNLHEERETHTLSLPPSLSLSLSF